MTQEVVTAVETAAEVTAPVVASGAPDWKKVAIYAGATVAVAGGAYLTYRMIKKRKEAKAAEAIIVINPENEVIPAEETTEVVEEPPKKTKK